MLQLAACLFGSFLVLLLKKFDFFQGIKSFQYIDRIGQFFR